MEILISYLQRPFIKRLLILTIVGMLLYLIRNQITMLLITFILIYLIDTAQKAISSKISKYIKINRIFIVIFLYVLLAGLLVLIIYKFVPEIIVEITEIVKAVTTYFSGNDFSKITDNVILSYIFSSLKEIDFQKYIQDSGTGLLNIVSSISTISLNILLTIILSLFFLIDKDKIVRFYHGFKNSKLNWMYTELNYFGERFANSFGKVIQTQILISLINSVLSLIILSVLRFPNVFGLTIMIFILGLVPVAGVIVSVVPLSIIAYSIGGFRYIVIVLVLILVLHILEGYVLNPKLMSHKTHLPVFITFLILIMSEHIFGVWGLIVGIPITMFLLDVLEVKMEK